MSSNEIKYRIDQPALTGIKVLDFGWALVGSLTGKHLADNGAKVIKIESTNRIDLSRTNRMVKISSGNNPDDKPWYSHLNTSKYSFAINLKSPLAKGVIERLVSWADVVNENFTPGTLTKLGMDYEYMKKINPDIIMLSASSYGQTGPMAYEWGVDGTGLAFSGYLDQTGWPDRYPVGANVPFGDVVQPYINALAIVAALDYRDRTGKGQHIDSSMVEVCTHLSTPSLLDLQANNHLRRRNGNRLDYACPHGVFPCQGEDRWCAIAVFSEDEWQAFCSVIGNPDWAKDSRFATLESRKKNEDALEELVSQWTRQHTDYEIMLKMQAAGVSAGVVQTMEDILDHDPQLKEREFLVPIKNPVLGIFGHPTPGFKLTKSKAQIRYAPLLGEHTESICINVLGMSDTEFATLVGENVFE
ncbi:MAG: CoA transferase [Dehalococcoidales bacterium]|jgi:crotonobetainyl-CoA:carnitine CoA-transferase CaiB-like acyl-CoA transferase|nr:CoA transferase [Dehalococcoidales bacterium]